MNTRALALFPAAAVAVMVLNVAPALAVSLPNDHLIVYKARVDTKDTPAGTKFTAALRTVRDDLGSQSCTIVKEKTLDVPADENGGGILDATRHLRAVHSRDGKGGFTPRRARAFAGRIPADTLREMAEAEDALKKNQDAARHRQILMSTFPQSPAARTFATLEAVAGQIYLAVLVARLVGLDIVHANSSQSSQEK